MLDASSLRGFAAVIMTGIIYMQIGMGLRLWKWAAVQLQLPQQYDLPSTVEPKVAALVALPAQLHGE